MIEHSF